MKKIIVILLFFYVNTYSQYTEDKISKIIINEHEIDTIKKNGYARINAYFHNELTQFEIIELCKIIGENESNTTYSFELNFKITKDGRIKFVTGEVHPRKRSVPEELRGLSQFDKTYHNNQEFIDFINHYFERKRYVFQLVNKNDKNKILDISKYSEYTFYNTFRFSTIKHYPKIIDNTKKIKLQ
jgi:hypothetical protein